MPKDGTRCPQKVQNIRRESQMESDDKGTVHRKQNETGQKIVRRRKKADEKEDALQELQLLKKQMKTRRSRKNIHIEGTRDRI